MVQLVSQLSCLFTFVLPFTLSLSLSLLLSFIKKSCLISGNGGLIRFSISPLEKQMLYFGTKDGNPAGHSFSILSFWSPLPGIPGHRSLPGSHRQHPHLGHSRFTPCSTCLPDLITGIPFNLILRRRPLAFTPFPANASLS